MKDYCWYTVKIDVANALNPSFVLPIKSSQAQLWKYPSQSVFNSDWLSYTESLGLKFIVGLLFYKKEHNNPIIAHLDFQGNISNITNQPAVVNFGFNWVFSGGNGSKMIWYEMPEEKTEIKWTPRKLPYMEWPSSRLKFIEEHAVTDKLTLVKTGIPHAIHSITGERWCMSARIDMPEVTSWDHIVDYLDKRNLLESRNI